MPADNNISYFNSPELMRPAGHYSHACVAGGVVYVSGQLPINEAGVALSDQPFDVQARQVLANLDACLAAAGTDRARLVQVRVYITDMSLWAGVVQRYLRRLDRGRPSGPCGRRRIVASLWSVA